MKQYLNSKTYKILSYIILIGAYLYLLYYMNLKIDCFMTSDMSYEVTLGKLLSKGNNPFITKEYLYTSEIRFLHENQIYGLVFRFCNDWHKVIIISAAIMYLLVLASYYYFCKQVKITKWYPITAVVFIVPLSMYYGDWVLFTLYYLSHIISLFLIWGLVLNISKESKDEKKIKARVLKVLLFIYSFMIGLNGIRILMLIYIPMLISGIIYQYIFFIKNGSLDKTNLFLKSFLIGFCGEIIGYIINTTYLVPNYSYWRNNLQFANFDWGKLLDVIEGYFVLLGYRTGPINLVMLIQNGLSFIIFILIIYCIVINLKKGFEKNQQLYMMTWFIVVANTVFMLSFLLIKWENTYEERYAIPFFMIWVPYIVVSLNTHNKKYLNYIITSIIILAIFCSYENYIQFKYLDKTADEREIAKYLVNTEYQEGYLAMDNTIAVFSNGKLKVYGWPAGNFDEMTNIDELQNFGQPISRLNKKPEGKIFVMIKKMNYEEWTLKEVVTEDDIIYETDNFYIFGFDSYKEFKERSLKIYNE